MPSGYKQEVVGLASTYDAGTLVAPHTHTAHQLVLAISGTMRVSVHHKIWFLPPARALWIPSRTRHAIRCIGPVEMRTAYISEYYPSAHTDVRVISVSPLLREVLVRLTEHNDSGLKLLLADLLLAETKQGSSEQFCLPLPSDSRIAELARRMQERPSDQTTLKKWAKRLGFSERNLIRVIRSETGMTFRELRRLTRVLVAIDKLSAGQSVTATALDVGFETPSAFIYAFRSLIGKTPRQFMSEN